MAPTPSYTPGTSCPHQTPALGARKPCSHACLAVGGGAAWHLQHNTQRGLCPVEGLSQECSRRKFSSQLSGVMSSLGQALGRQHQLWQDWGTLVPTVNSFPDGTLPCLPKMKMPLASYCLASG